MSKQLQICSTSVRQYKIFNESIRPQHYYTQKPRKICTDHVLCDLYDQVYRKDPLIFNTQTFDNKIGMKVKGKDAGTLFKPKLKVLTEASSPSLFGKGEENVYDEEVRLGREILAKDIKFTNEASFGNGLKAIMENLKKDFLPNEILLLVLYKMAIYGKGGHFKTHRDTPLAPNHVATLLLEIRSTHKGGKLVFTFGTEGSSVELKDSSVDKLAYCVFFTDVNHAVERLTSGTRVVLQFCIYTTESADRHLPTVDADIFTLLLDSEDSNKKAKKKPRITTKAPAKIAKGIKEGGGVVGGDIERSDSDGKSNSEPESSEREDNESDDYNPQYIFLEGSERTDTEILFENLHKQRKKQERIDELLFPNFKVFNQIELALYDHDFKSEWLALPTWHLYLDGVKGSLLKGVDREFYQHFSSKFNIEVLPVIFFRSLYPDDQPQRDVIYITLEDINHLWERPKNILTLAPKSMKTEHVFHQGQIEYTGNEGMAEENSYFAAVLLIKGPKKDK